MEQVSRTVSNRTDQFAAWCQVVEHAPVAMALTLGTSHTLHCVSPALAQLFDAAPVELHERPFADAVSLANRDAVAVLLDRVLTTGTAEVSATLEQLHPRRGIVSYTCAVWRIGMGDEPPAGLVVQIHDITRHVETHQADEAIALNLREVNERLVLAGLREHAARAEVEAALAVRDQFLSIAAHELKTPLTALLGYMYVLEHSLDRIETDQLVQQATATIKRQAQRLDTLIDQLLDVSRMERGQFNIDRQPLDLTGLVTQVVERTRLTLTSHTLTLTSPDASVLVLGDDLRLEQVVQNLLNNAVKYSPAGGSVVVTLGQTGSDAILEVTDRGIGIPTEAQPRLFDSFFRAGNAGQQHGFGIGLYVVKEIVTQHGGRIDVESAEGQGSTFRVVVPLYAEVWA